MKFSYRRSGVDYQVMDPWKQMAQLEGLKTAVNLKKKGFREIIKSRGESAYVVEYKDCYFALVEECLGTKSIVAEETEKVTGKCYYDFLAQDSIAYIVNDLITVGAQPVSLVAYWALGGSNFFKNNKKMNLLVKGWANACNVAEVSWGGGETPALSGIINKNSIDIAGAAFGIIKPKHRLILGDKLESGDLIIFLESQGIQSNGVSLARKIVDKLPQGYKTNIGNGAIFGEALLVPTIIYVKLIMDLLNMGIDIHYMANITGHGWRKIMRADRSFTYIIDKVTNRLPVFDFIQKKSGLSDKDMYSTFNMGAGFAIYVAPDDADEVISIAKKHKIKAWVAGRIENGPKKVVIKPLNIIYTERDLMIR